MTWISWIYSQLFYCKRRLCPNAKRNMPFIPVNRLPWFWVGAKRDVETVTVTDIINNYVKYGIPVTSKLLSELTNINEDVVWKYIDSKTLEEKDFPPEGILIEDDTLHRSVSNT